MSKRTKNHDLAQDCSVVFSVPILTRTVPRGHRCHSLCYLRLLDLPHRWQTQSILRLNALSHPESFLLNGSGNLATFQSVCLGKKTVHGPTNFLVKTKAFLPSEDGLLAPRCPRTIKVEINSETNNDCHDIFHKY